MQFRVVTLNLEQDHKRWSRNPTFKGVRRADTLASPFPLMSMALSLAEWLAAGGKALESVLQNGVARSIARTEISVVLHSQCGGAKVCF